MQPRRQDRPEDHLPLKAIDFHILLALAERELHGYGLVKAIEDGSGGRLSLEPGNLYRYLRRLVDEGLVQPVGRRAAAESNDERRRYYALTGLGARVLAAEGERMRALADAVDAHRAS